MKKNNLKNIFYVLSIIGLIGLSSCYKDINEETLIDTRIPGAEIIEQYNGGLTVYVTDINGVAIDGADVFVYDSKSISDKFGIAEFKDIPLDRSGTFVSAIKEDLLYGAEKFNPTEINNHVIIRMLPIQGLKTFDSNENVSIEITNGGNIVIKSNSVVDLQGNPYNGEVSIFVNRIETNNPYFSQIVNGDHTGVDKNGSAKILEIYCAVVVEMFDTDGNELHFLEGKEAKINLVMADGLISSAPDNIPFWSFDKNAGVWKEVGTAVFSDNKFEGFIKTPKSWICAKPYNYVNIQGRVEDQNATGIPNADIKIIYNSIVSDATTDGEGNYYLKVPADKTMRLQVYKAGCDELFYNEEITTGFNDIELDPVVLNLSNISNVEGYLLCMGSPHESAIVYAITPHGTYKYEGNESGYFNFLLLESKCNPIPSVTILGLDPTDLNQSPPKEISLDDPAVYQLDVCADCQFFVEIESTILDNCNLLVELKLSVSGGSGSYDYKWEEGSVGSSITVTENEEYCVTVTDKLTDCAIISCTTFSSPLILEVSASASSLTCNDNGNGNMLASGGVEPYEYQWIGPNGYSSNQQEIFDLASPGFYSYSVTDINGCLADGVVTVGDETNSFELDVFTNTSNNVICDDEEKILTIECDGCNLDLQSAVWYMPDGSEGFGESILATQAGIYNVVIQSLNCSTEGTIQLQKVEYDIPEINFACDGSGNYNPSVVNLESGFNAFFPEIFYEELVTNFDNLTTIDYSIDSPYPSCSKTFSTILPIYEGLIIEEIIVASCDTCADGQIVLSNDGAICENCLFGNNFIYLEGDYETDLNIANQEGLLMTGNYYIVSKSVDGCVVNSVQITL